MPWVLDNASLDKISPILGAIIDCCGSESFSMDLLPRMITFCWSRQKFLYCNCFACTSYAFSTSRMFSLPLYSLAYAIILWKITQTFKPIFTFCKECNLWGWYNIRLFLNMTWSILRTAFLASACLLLWAGAFFYIVSMSRVANVVYRVCVPPAKI